MAKLSKDEIIEAIKEMTVMELSELVSEMEEVFGVSAAAPAAAVMAGPADGAGAGSDEQVEFNVVLKSAGDQRVKVIKAVREVTDLGLKEAKALVEEAPVPVKEGIEKADAEAIKAKLEEQGAVVTIE